MCVQNRASRGFAHTYLEKKDTISIKMDTQTFSATIEKNGTRLLIALPFDPNGVWGEKERHHINGTVNGFAFRGQLSMEGPLYYLKLGPAWLRDSGLSAGAPVEVSITPEGPQGDRLPADVRAALEADPGANTFFESLPTFYRNNFMRSIEGAKRPETRAARIAQMMELLKARKRQA
jgi:hypothetical protein